MGCYTLFDGQQKKTVTHIGAGVRVSTVDRALEAAVRAEKLRRAAHLNDDRSTAENPGRLPQHNLSTTVKGYCP